MRLAKANSPATRLDRRDEQHLSGYSIVDAYYCLIELRNTTSPESPRHPPTNKATNSSASVSGWAMILSGYLFLVLGLLDMANGTC